MPAIWRCTIWWPWTAVAQWLKCYATNRKVAGSIPAGVTGIFHWHKILPIALWPWGQLSFYQMWVPGIFPGGKGGRCVRLTTLPPSCAVVMKSVNLNFLEPSGPLQACNWNCFTIWWPTFATLTAVSFYCLHNVSTLHKSWKAPCVMSVLWTLSQLPARPQLAIFFIFIFYFFLLSMLHYLCNITCCCYLHCTLYTEY